MKRLALKKGFTLIELLAVIVILAIILLIAMPVVLNVISNARKGAFEATARGLLKTVENEYMRSSLKGNNSLKSYIFVDNEQTVGDLLEFSGRGPQSGTIIVYENGDTEMAISDGTWCVTKDRELKDINPAILDDGNCVLPSEVGAITGPCGGETSVTYEGQAYNVFEIGDQCWFAENLNVGTRIDGALGQNDLNVIQKYCYDDNPARCDEFGGLYTWAQATNYASYGASDGSDLVEGICPPGWLLPSHHDWTTLERNVCTSGSCETDFPFDITTTHGRGTNEGDKLKDASFDNGSFCDGVKTIDLREATGGTFRLNIGESGVYGCDTMYTTDPIPYNANADQIKAVLNAEGPWPWNLEETEPGYFVFDCKAKRISSIITDDLVGSASLFTNYDESCGSVGFNAKPAGQYQVTSGEYSYLGMDAIFFSSTLRTAPANHFFDRNIYAGGSDIYRGGWVTSVGDAFSVRCVKNQYIGETYSDAEIDDLIDNGDFIPIASVDDILNINDVGPNIFGVGTEWEDEYEGGNDKKYVQVKGVVLDEDFEPISFGEGVFDGGGFSIVGIDIDDCNPASGYGCGLFSRVVEGEIKNIVLINPKIINVKRSGGALAGIIYNTKISDVHVYGARIRGVSRLGALVGEVIDDVGIPPSNITNCSAQNVDVRGHSLIGGLIGWVQDGVRMNQTFTTGFVKAAFPSGTWGNMGSAGGLIGGVYSADLTTIVENSYSRAYVVSTNGAGGLFGYAEFNEFFESDELAAKVVGSYSSGPVVYVDHGDTEEFHKGMIAFEEGGDREFLSLNNYYDSENSGRNDIGNGSPRTTTQMKQQATYFSWDYSNRWMIDENINDGYPFLRDLPKPLKLAPTPAYSTGLPYACSRQQASNTGAINWNAGAPAYVTTCPAQTDGWSWSVTNDVAYDFNTGLYWTSRRLSSANYATAVSHCVGLTFGGRGDWRLPTLDEIRQAHKNGMYSWNPVFAHPSSPSFFRTINEVLGDSTRTLTFNFNPTGISNHQKTANAPVRCVARDY